jgi:hypothetical protein
MISLDLKEEFIVWLLTKQAYCRQKATSYQALEAFVEELWNARLP